MSQNLTKKQRGEVRKLQALAWQRELDVELGKLEEHFRSWKDSAIDAFELSDRIHKLHDGESRELYKLYTYHNSPYAVPSAIARGLICESEVSKQSLDLS